MTHKTITLSIQEKDSDFLHKESKKESLSMSFIVRQALAAYKKERGLA